MAPSLETVGDTLLRLCEDVANGLGTPESLGVRKAPRIEDVGVLLAFKCLATFAYESIGLSPFPSSSSFAEPLSPLLVVPVVVVKNDDSSISPLPKNARFTNFQNQSEIIDIAVKYVTTATIAVQDEIASEYSSSSNANHEAKTPRRCCARSFLFSSKIFVTNSSTFSFAFSNLTSHR